MRKANEADCSQLVVFLLSKKKLIFENAERHTGIVNRMLPIIGSKIPYKIVACVIKHLSTQVFGDIELPALRTTIAKLLRAVARHDPVSENWEQWIKMPSKYSIRFKQTPTTVKKEHLLRWNEAAKSGSRMFNSDTETRDNTETEDEAEAHVESRVHAGAHVELRDDDEAREDVEESCSEEELTTEVLRSPNRSRERTVKEQPRSVRSGDDDE